MVFAPFVVTMNYIIGWVCIGLGGALGACIWPSGAASSAWH
jgi:hypothetical protein